MAYRFYLFFAVILSWAVAAEPMVPCKFFMGFTHWSPLPNCPAAGTQTNCTTDADCAALPNNCSYGGTSNLRCSADTETNGVSVCGMYKQSWPTLDKPGGVCDNSTQGCAICLGGECQGIPLCVDWSFCNATAGANAYDVKCFPNGHTFP